MPEIINNYLSPASFTISIDRMPNVEFFAQAVSIPGISASPVELNTPLRTFYAQQDKLSYDDLSVQFILDENMTNYQEVLGWLEGLGFPEDTDQHKNYIADNNLESDI